MYDCVNLLLWNSISFLKADECMESYFINKQCEYCENLHHIATNQNKIDLLPDPKR